MRMDATVAVTCDNQYLIPILRKNRRLENRWGQKYHAAVRNAVFGTQSLPYKPSELPPSLKEHALDADSLFVCTYCKDCFHFRSSFEDHNTRRSWILGLWCQQCFVTICTHMSSEGSPCSDCLKLDRDKRSYLRHRGLAKGHKFGAVRVFYNQCQFFAHLKAHNVNFVDMGDVMLMPLPADIDNNWSPELDIVCEAFMEQAFILKIHVMDWLKAKKIDSNWWKLAANTAENKGDLVSEIIGNYKGRFFFKQIETTIMEQLSTVTSSCSMANNNTVSPDIEILGSKGNDGKKKKSSCTDITTSNSEQNVIEQEDNPCTVNDITFVDCGPASKYFEPELPVNNISRKHSTIFVKSSQDSPNAFQPANIVKLSSKSKRIKNKILNCSSSDIPMSYGNITITPKLDSKDSTTCVGDTQPYRNITRQYNKVKTPIKVVTESNITMTDADTKIDKMIIENMESSLARNPEISCSATKTSISENTLEKSKQNVHILGINSGQKVLSFQNPISVDFNKVINQLPPNLVNNKKFVFMEQDSDGSAVNNKQESLAKRILQLVPDSSLGKAMKSLQPKMVPLNVPGDLSNDANKTVAQTQSDQVTSKMQHMSYTNKVVYQNGRKYIVKHMGSPVNMANVQNMSTKDGQTTKQGTSENGIPSLIPLNFTESETTTTPEKVALFHSDISPLTPSPSPSELSSSSSCDVQSKQPSTASRSLLKSEFQTSQVSIDGIEAGVSMLDVNDSYESLSFHKGDDENLYLDVKFLNQKPAHTIADTCGMITKCKQEMLNEFFHLSYSELKKRHDHLQHIANGISKVMDFVSDAVIKENLKSIHILEHIIRLYMQKCTNKFVDTSEDDAPLHKWEVENKFLSTKPRCTTCNKVVKPKSYVPGFSKPPKKDVYCSCYRHVCHKCHTYQGNSTRFIAHRSFHNQQPPYLCPDCCRQYGVFKLLEVHTWTTCFHMLKKRVLGCRICEIDGFPDMEAITRHFAIMHSNSKIACDKCYLVLPSYTEYKKHSREVHSVTENHEPIRLALCKLGRCIVRYEDYMLHMEKHLAVQRLVWLKCPFCPFINLDGKRIMTHLQTEHLERLLSIISTKTLWTILPSELSMILLKNNPQMGVKLTRFTETYEDGTIIPKIINTRTITSEVFERGAQETDDDLIMAIGDSTSTKTSVQERSDNNILSANCDSTDVPKIVNVVSTSKDNCDQHVCETSSSNETDSGDVLPKILEVRSIAEKVSKVAPASKENEEKYTDAEEKKPLANLSEDKIKCSTVACTVEKKAVQPKSEDTGQLKIEALEDPVKREDPTGDEEEVKMKLKLEELKETVDCPSNQQTDKNVNFLQQIPIVKPPPLSRIPQQVLDVKTPTKSSPVQTTKGLKEKSGSSRSHRTSRQILRRLALNGPATSDEKVYNFSCHACREPMNTSWSVVSAHFRMRHAQDYKLSIVAPKLLRISPEFINGGYKDVLGSRKRKSDSVLSNSKRRRRWTPKKYTEPKSINSPGLGLCVQKETAEDGEGNFKCKKCNQRCTDMANLREHIATNHRIKGRYLICLECGENFVVAPSLQMHLKAFHGIEDPITYMTQNTSYAPDNVDDLEIEGKTIEANQCHVCMAVFEGKAAVDKHLRVHGMAFLNRKRIEAQNALKSPEKKGEVEEGKQISDKTVVKEIIKKENPAETILEKINATI